MTRAPRAPAPALGVHLALLRGVNVGGKNKLPMAALRRLFAAAGCQDVQSYIQSGNVLYRAPPRLARELPRRISAAIAADLGLEVPVVCRSLDALRTAVQANPFAEAGVDPDQLHVMFLAARPQARAAASLDPERSPPDRFALRDQEIYLHCPNGVARTKLSNAYFDRALGTVGTQRSWKTTLKLLELAAAL